MVHQSRKRKGGASKESQGGARRKTQLDLQRVEIASERTCSASDRDSRLLLRLGYESGDRPTLPGAGELCGDSIEQTRTLVSKLHLLWRRSFCFASRGSNLKRRYEIVCNKEGCAFLFKAAWCSKLEGMVTKNFKPHSCSAMAHDKGYEACTMDLLLRYFADVVESHLESRTRVRDLRRSLIDTYGIDCGKNICFRALQRLGGKKADDSYVFLRSWLESLASADFGFLVDQEWDGHRFCRVAISACHQQASEETRLLCRMRTFAETEWAAVRVLYDLELQELARRGKAM
eukprot:scaffold7112_cov219-Pinguiococcus_pyrenoidosus.AAC.1